MSDSKEPQDPLKTPDGQRIDKNSFAELQATPHSANPDLGDMRNDESRKDVAQAMNSEMFVFNITEFLAHYGPSPATAVTTDDIAGCKEYLFGAKLLDKRRDGGQTTWVWRGFPTNPAQSNEKEPVAFEPLGTIVNGIWDYAGKVQDKKKHGFLFKMVPSNHIESSISGANHMMDACIIEVAYKDKLVNNKIVVPVELKKKWAEDDQIKVREQVVGDCHHILCDDPRRMFIYAITIENDRFSVWYFSRTHSVKAMAFKWLSGDGIDTFIRVMLAFAYATPKDLGFDPYVHKSPLLDWEDGQRWIYEFEVDKDFTTVEAQAKSDSKAVAPIEARATRALHTSEPAEGKKKIFFRTIRARAPMRPVCISGRTTRIWEVIEVPTLRDHDPVDGAVPVILKDVWLDAASPTEGKNQEAVFSAVDQFVADGLKAHPGKDGLMRFINAEPRFQHFNERTKKRLASLLTDQKYRELFLTKILEWEGELTKERHDHVCRTDRPMFASANLTGTAGIPSLSTRFGPSTQIIPATKISSIVPQPPDVVARREYAQKKQVRLVYKEVCTEIHNMGTFGEVMEVARQALDALQILYCAGWVHRDISTGNIMAVPVRNAAGKITNWKVKLADLEFSQVVGHKTHKSDPRTGTPFFMPVEIMRKRYLACGFFTPEAAMAAEFARQQITQKVPPAKRNLATKFDLSMNHRDYEHYSRFRQEASNFFDNQLPQLSVHEDIPYDHVKNNYQHDLESLWWMMLYFITACAGCDTSEAYAKSIFHRDLIIGQRKDVLATSLSEGLTPGTLHGALYRIFFLPMETLRDLLYQQYIQRAICGNMTVHSAYSLIHAEFAEQLDLILDGNIGDWKELPIVLKDSSGKPVSKTRAELPFGSTKRGREEDADKMSAVGKAPKKVKMRK